jgi:Tol biopolymer transport system component
MPWTEDEFRRALDEAAEDARPRSDALAVLRAKARRQQRVRAIGYPLAGLAAAAAAVLLVVNVIPERRATDVEVAGPAPAATGQIQLTDAPAVREDADGGSILPDISADGRHVVFMSDASNLVPGDANKHADTFERDLSTGKVELVSVGLDGASGNGDSLSATISGDGRVVAFRSFASNLVEGDMNGRSDIFVRDMVAHVTTRISVGRAGAEADADSDSAVISANGRFVAFRSAASNLVPGDTNSVPDIFVADRNGGGLVRVSKSADGRQATLDSRTPAISADGSRVVFSSIAPTLVSGDTNETWDVFLADLPAETLERVSVSSDGTQGNLASVFPSISADGRVVGFVSSASNLVPGDTNRVRDVFVRDVAARATERASLGIGGVQANGPTLSASLSGDGRLVAFSSDASILVAGDRNSKRDIFVRDRVSGAVELVSLSSSGAPADEDSGGPAMTPDGRYVVFQSFASTLAAGDANRRLDVFVHDRANRTTARLSGRSTRT